MNPHKSCAYCGAEEFVSRCYLCGLWLCTTHDLVTICNNSKNTKFRHRLGSDDTFERIRTDKAFREMLVDEHLVNLPPIGDS